ILGVDRDASPEEIKTAFRTLARKYHPDVAADPATAEARFKELNEANEVLRDPETRRRYDALGEHWKHPERRAAPAQGGFAGEAEGGSDYHFDGTGFSDFFEQFFGSRGHAAAGWGRQQGYGEGGPAFARPGQDIEGDIMVSLDEALHGSTRTITLRRVEPGSGQSSAQTLRVNIPAGVREGQLVRLAGIGLEGTGGGAPGHLYLRVRFAAHPDFRVKDADLYFELDLAPWEAVLGTTVRTPTLDGVVALKIPAATPAAQHLRMRGKGLPRGDGTRGDLYAIVNIQVPDQVTPEQKALWEQLAAKATFDPRRTS
ncbi:MAG: DnaJ C-terminal domain-containing protein, partial [Candidatus Eisenbacteria bacterium]